MSFLPRTSLPSSLVNEISQASSNQKKLYSIITSLTYGVRDNPLPPHESIQQLADDFGDFFISKIEKIRLEIDSQNADPPVLPMTPSCECLSTFETLSESEVRKLVMESKTTSCALDPIPTSLLKQCIDCILPILTIMVNLSLQTGIFPNDEVVIGCYLKCLDSYCIPRRHVCDGLLDCPAGHDEDNCHKPLRCIGLFWCPVEELCLSHRDICDGLIHCPKSNADELLCDVGNCPEDCCCFGYGVDCANQSLQKLSPPLTKSIYILNLRGNKISDRGFLRHLHSIHVACTVKRIVMNIMNIERQ